MLKVLLTAAVLMGLIAAKASVPVTVSALSAEPPQNLRGEIAVHCRVDIFTLEWDPVLDFAGSYTVERALISTSQDQRTFAVVGVVEGTTFIEELPSSRTTGLLPVYRVRSGVGNDVGPPGEERVLIPPPTDPDPCSGVTAAAPTNLRGQPVPNSPGCGSTLYPIVWSTVPGFTGPYTIERALIQHVSDTRVFESIGLVESDRAATELSSAEYLSDAGRQGRTPVYRVRAGAENSVGPPSEPLVAHIVPFVPDPCNPERADTHPTPLAPAVGSGLAQERDRGTLAAAAVLGVLAATAGAFVTRYRR